MILRSGIEEHFDAWDRASLTGQQVLGNVCLGVGIDDE